MLTLYYTPGSCSFASHLALEEGGAEFHARRVNLAEGEQRTPAFRAINPQGRVPALAMGEDVITENMAILTYIATRYPQAHLLPLDNPIGLAKANAMLSWFATDIHVSFAQIFRGERFADDVEIQQALKSEGRKRVVAALERIERIAGERTWMLGDDFSVLDGYATVFWRWGPRLELDMDAFPAWSGHARRVLDRPAAKRVLACEAAAAT